MKEARTDYPVNIELVKKYYNLTDNADFAIVFVASPVNPLSGYDFTFGLNY